MRRSRNGCRKEGDGDERSLLVPHRRRKTEPYAPLRYEAGMKQPPHKKGRKGKFILGRE
jgi:hypothetical protein